jgi:WD40 repeat protein
MLPVHDSAIMAVATTQDGVVSVSRANTPRFTNLTTGHSTDIEGGGASSAITAIAFSPAGDGLYCGQADGAILAWDTRESMIPGQNARVQSLAFTTDGHLLASAGSNGIVRIWSPDPFEQVGNSLTGHTGSVRAVVFSPDGGQIFAAGEDGTIHVWDSPGREAFCQHGSKVRAVAAGADRIISGGEDGLVKVWDRSTGAQVHKLTGHSGSVVMVAAYGNEIVSAADDGVRLWSAATGELLAEQEARGTVAAALSVDGVEVIFAGSAGEIRFWDRPHGTTVSGSVPARFRALTLTPDRTEIVFGGMGGAVWVADRDSNALVEAPTVHKSGVTAIAVTPDGSWIISGSEDGAIHIWDRATGGTIVLTGHDSAVWSVAVAPDGDRIVSGGQDGTVRVWDLAGGQPIETFVGHTGEVYSVAVDGSGIVSGGADGTVRRWEELSGSASVVRADPLAEVVSDLESEHDRLGITGDVNTIAAVVGALSTTPPLSIALLGDWGGGEVEFHAAGVESDGGIAGAVDGGCQFVCGECAAGTVQCLALQ